MGVLDLALGEVAEGGAGVLEGGGVAGVGGGEFVAGGDCLLHEVPAVLAPRHRLLVLDLRLVATHFLNCPKLEPLPGSDHEGSGTMLWVECYGESCDFL